MQSNRSWRIGCLAVAVLVPVLVIAAAGPLGSGLRDRGRRDPLVYAFGEAARQSVRLFKFAILEDYHRLVDRWAIRGYLRTQRVRKLQIGAGPSHLAGWLNTDFRPAKGQVYLDASRRFPLPDASFQFAYGEHVIEHLTYEAGVNMLRETYRVLAPGGRVRIATPDLARFAALFQEPRTEDARRYIVLKLGAAGSNQASPACALLDAEVYGYGHQHLYDAPHLRESLERAGFRQVQQFAPGESDTPELRGIESRHDSPDRFVNDYETMVFEAVRP